MGKERETGPKGWENRGACSLKKHIYTLENYEFNSHLSQARDVQLEDHLSGNQKSSSKTADKEASPR